MSSPLVAGILSFLVNAARKHDGKPLGFLNPFLYEMWEALFHLGTPLEATWRCSVVRTPVSKLAALGAQGCLV